jgi:hypothetical protein
MHTWSKFLNRSGVEGLEPAGDSSLIFRQQKISGRVANIMHYTKSRYVCQLCLFNCVRGSGPGGVSHT